MESSIRYGMSDKARDGELSSTMPGLFWLGLLGCTYNHDTLMSFDLYPLIRKVYVN